MHRNHVNKQHSAKKFKSQIRKTKVMNIKGPMRGGIRL